MIRRLRPPFASPWGGILTGGGRPGAAGGLGTGTYQRVDQGEGTSTVTSFAVTIPDSTGRYFIELDLEYGTSAGWVLIRPNNVTSSNEESQSERTVGSTLDAYNFTSDMVVMYNAAVGRNRALIDIDCDNPIHYFSTCHGVNNSNVVQQSKHVGSTTDSYTLTSLHFHGHAASRITSYWYTLYQYT